MEIEEKIKIARRDIKMWQDIREKRLEMKARHDAMVEECDAHVKRLENEISQYGIVNILI
jgi:hypothetical protein